MNERASARGRSRDDEESGETDSRALPSCDAPIIVPRERETERERERERKRD